MSDGPFQQAFDADTHGVVRREIVTYRYVDGVMIMETATRTYSGGDYNDSRSTIPLVENK
jgi:hypothetical protein